VASKYRSPLVGFIAAITSCSNTGSCIFFCFYFCKVTDSAANVLFF
jgi:hypothetical protein